MQDTLLYLDKLKKKQNLVILAHYYQDPNFQNVGDFMGDILSLAKQFGKDAFH